MMCKKLSAQVQFNKVTYANSRSPNRTQCWPYLQIFIYIYIYTRVYITCVYYVWIVFKWSLFNPICAPFNFFTCFNYEWFVTLCTAILKFKIFKLASTPLASGPCRFNRVLQLKYTIDQSYRLDYSNW